MNTVRTPVRPHWYAVSRTRGKWSDLNSEAKTYNAYLVAITSRAENDFITKELLTKTTGDAWIGLHRDGDTNSPNPSPNPITNSLVRPVQVRGYIRVNPRRQGTTPAQALADLRLPTTRWSRSTK
ncbi:MAG: C-type lectin domain-containing protein [Pedosphaera sp.]|nr:C-type lectin domain-containing protein [Pedosphaera sp.]